ncbi:twitching motility response regulator PilH [Ramlibacter solisilvae]|uniref:Chemotaxis protein CheY n=1 Tax=Ramlibacter tataouinensis TaxID=94132 RepID=A0A127JVQ3_9BURK|nr:response regulator [Ramlibacter tataouinensis]AMO24004.1 chemotaxis protein CheY [Ramlibacter tataouinensis]
MARKILIVDDALVDRQNLERILSGAGHVVLQAESGEEALASARAHRPDVILMDVNMPDLDGFATTRRLKSDGATKDIPVVFVTGKNQKADLAWGRMLGARGYVAKPYTREDILAQLEG